jgi:NodT family efflux transporter outer membrane factor (OMF) lipoprotein
MRKPPTSLRNWRIRSWAQAATLIVLPLTGFAACAPDLGPKPEPTPIQAYATQQSFAGPQSSWPDADWWKAYGDSQLNGLMDEALAGSPDLKIAEARMREADAVAQESGADLFPTLTANGSASETRTSLNQGFPESFKSFLPHGWHSEGKVTGDLDYEIDLFGKNRAAFAAATSDAEAAQVDFAAARLSISTSVASAYANLVQLTADRAAAQDALNVRQQSADLIAQRLKQQLENTGELSQEQSRVESAKADLDKVDGQIAVARNQLAALLGKGPDRGLAIALPTDAKVMPFGVPPSLAADLLGRRPDIVAARLRADSASSRIDVAHAAFYPNIDLTGNLGQQSFGISDLLSPASHIGQIGPAISLPIFDGGKIEGNYRDARAEYDEAVATYDKTVTGALHDVADALANQRELTNELAHARASLTASGNAYRVASLRYKAGLSRYLDVLTAEDTLVEQRRDVADLQAKSFSQDVVLVQALGGGFVFEGKPDNTAVAAKE